MLKILILSVNFLRANFQNNAFIKQLHFIICCDKIT